MQAIRAAIYRTLASDPPMTVRQLFYQLVSQGVIAKTEQEYKGTVGRLLTEMRLDGSVPFGWVADNTRWQRKPTTYGSLSQALQRTAETYRRALWDELPVYCEIWLEKDALAGVLISETSDWDVPLMVTRGYASLSYLYEAAEHISEIGKPTYIYYLGDHDPSGVDIPRHVEARLREFAPGAEIHFERIAVTPGQIRFWGLPTRPTKSTDSRAKGFDGASVEVDAIPPATLRALVRDCISQHVDKQTLSRMERIEAAERESAMRMAYNYALNEQGHVGD
jgi:hypothetical protein